MDKNYPRGVDFSKTNKKDCEKIKNSKTPKFRINSPFLRITKKDICIIELKTAPNRMDEPYKNYPDGKILLSIGLASHHAILRHQNYFL